MAVSRAIVGDHHLDAQTGSESEGVSASLLGHQLLSIPHPQSQGRSDHLFGLFRRQPKELRVAPQDEMSQPLWPGVRERLVQQTRQTLVCSFAVGHHQSPRAPWMPTIATGASGASPSNSLWATAMAWAAVPIPERSTT